MEVLYNDLKGLAQEADLPEIVTRLDQTRQQIAANKLRVIFIGKFNHGKSLIINTLLEQPRLLLVGATPTTRMVTEIDYGAEEAIHYTDKLGRVQNVRLSDYYEQNLTTPSQTNDHLTITAPNPILRDVTYVDTLGLDDPDTAAVERIGQEINRADVIVFVLSATQAMTAAEQAFLAERLPKESRRKLIFVLNQVDRLNDEDNLADVLERSKAILRNFVAEPLILPYSAFVAAKALSKAEKDEQGLEQAYYGDVKKALSDDLVAEKSRLQEAALHESLLMMAEAIEKSLTLKQIAAQQTPETLEKAQAELTRQISRLEKVRERIQSRVAADIKRKCELFLADVNTYARRVGNALPQQLETVEESEGVYEVLPFYLEHTLKDFIEARAEPFQRETELYLKELSSEIEKEFETAVRALNMGDSYFVATMPSERSERSFSSWLSGGLTVLGATTIFLFGNVLIGLFYLIGAEVVRRTLAFQKNQKGKLAEQGQKVLDETLRAVHDKLDVEFTEVNKNLQQKIDHVFSINIAAMQNQLDETAKTVKLSRAEHEALTKRTEQNLASLATLRERIANFFAE